jgi:TRAP transporter TAXI family solute receptor
MRHKIVMVILSVALIVGLVFVGCAEPTPAPTPTPTPAPAPTPTPEPEWPESILFGSSSPPTSSWYPLHCKMAELGGRGMGIPVTVIYPGGGEACLNAWYNGELDVTHATMPASYESIHGLGRWEGKPIENRLRMLYFRDANPLLMAVRADSDMDAFPDLQGKKIYVGYPGSTGYGQMDKSLDALGIEYEEFVGELSDGITAFKDGRIDAFGKSASGRSVDASHMDIMSTTDIKFLSYTAEETARIQAKYPWLGFIDYPAGWYEQLPDLGALTINLYDNNAITSTDFPEELAYRWTKSVIENWDETVAVFPANEFYDPVAALVRMPPDVYLHPGAIRYYREIGAEIPESAIPPEMK